MTTNTAAGGLGVSAVSERAGHTHNPTTASCLVSTIMLPLLYLKKLISHMTWERVAYDRQRENRTDSKPAAKNSSD